jgi:hypothetical protein
MANKFVHYLIPATSSDSDNHFCIHSSIKTISIMEKNFPLWVRIGLWGVSSKKVFWIITLIMVVVLGLLISSGIYSLSRKEVMDPEIAVFAFLLLLGLIHYFFIYRWLTKHDQWANVNSFWPTGKDFFLAMGIFLLVVFSIVLLRALIENL